MARRPNTLIATAIVCALAACSGDGGSSVASTTVPSAPTTEPTEIAVDDGVLTIGVLLPLSGAGAEMGRTLVDAVRMAVIEVNRAGGVLGQSLRVIAVTDEGDGIDTAAAAAEKLLREPIDAMVGPASSLAAPLVLPLARNAGVLTCSPTASALGLDAFPDEGLFMRTIPSDSMQAVALARSIDQTGVRSASILYLDDDYGRPYAQAVAAELTRLSIAVRSVVPYRSDDADYSDDATAASDDGAEVVAVIGDASTGPRVVTSLFDAVDDTVQVVVNDSMRVPAIPGAYERLTPAQLARLSGVSPRSTSVATDFAERLAIAFPGDRDLFATNAYDCVNVLALAAAAADSTLPASISAEIAEVTAGGSRCASFTGCVADQLAGRNIDYDGPSGQLQIGADGDPTRGLFDVFTFDPTGADVTESSLVVLR
jgi:branched-chain amino acid transport system substrate-binding protein